MSGPHTLFLYFRTQPDVHCDSLPSYIFHHLLTQDQSVREMGSEDGHTRVRNHSGFGVAVRVCPHSYPALWPSYPKSYRKSPPAHLHTHTCTRVILPLSFQTPVWLLTFISHTFCLVYTVAVFVDFDLSGASGRSFPTSSSSPFSPLKGSPLYSRTRWVCGLFPISWHIQLLTLW